MSLSLCFLAWKVGETMPPTGLLSSLEMKYVKRLVPCLTLGRCFPRAGYWRGCGHFVSVLDRTFSVTCPQELNKTRVWESAAPGGVPRRCTTSFQEMGKSFVCIWAGGCLLKGVEKKAEEEREQRFEISPGKKNREFRMWLPFPPTAPHRGHHQVHPPLPESVVRSPGRCISLAFRATCVPRPIEGEHLFQVIKSVSSLSRRGFY